MCCTAGAGRQRSAGHFCGIPFSGRSDWWAVQTARHLNNGSGGWNGEVRYKAWGETCYASSGTPTTFRFTGQRSEEAGLGSLYDYGARFYSPVIGPL